MQVVFGANGRAGGETARALMAAGEAVRVVLRRAEQAGPWTAAGAQVAIASMEDAGAVAAAASSSFFALAAAALRVRVCASAAWRAASSAWRRASSSRFFASSESMIGAAGAAGFSGSTASGLSTFTNVRFLRTSTWIVRALPDESARLISVVCLRVSVIFFFSSLLPWTSRR